MKRTAVLGAGNIAMLHPAILKDQVITPGRVTISAIETATSQSRYLTQGLLSKFSNES